jgi:hypothetical protein
MVTGLESQEKINQGRTDMLEAIASILLTTVLLALGAILFVFVCAMIGWMVYTTQNGDDDD